MKRILYITVLVFLFCGAKTYAQDKQKERIYIVTDRDNYVSGETMWLTCTLLNQNYKLSTLSKVAYVEISDTQRPFVQEKMALVHSQGQLRVVLPADMPSGVYQLSGYTRYMRNEGDEVFFTKNISVVNPKERPVSSRAKMVPYEKVSEKKTMSSVVSLVKITTDKNAYQNREKVQLSLFGVPDDAVKVIVSVSGVDSLSCAFALDGQSFKNTIEKNSQKQDNKYLPEYEGHIISARLDSDAKKGEAFLSNISFVGENIRYINGQQNEADSSFYFYTTGIYGQQEIVASVASSQGEQVPYHLDVVSAFAEKRPKELPILEFYPSEKQITDRYVASQIHNIVSVDSSSRIDMDYYHFPVTVSYDLDQWKRFNTLGETLMEFVYKVSARKVGDTRRLYVYSESMQGFNKGNTLVLLDGVPIFNHGDILDYNPRNVKTLNIYDGHFIFANEMYDAIVSLVSKTKDLPFFKLNDMYQMFQYKCPSLPMAYPVVDYSSAEAKNSRMPDMRYTLYWNADIMPSSEVNIPFYTSDMSGDFAICVTVIASDGAVLRFEKTFSVKE